MEKIQPQSSLDSGLPEIEPPVVLPCVLEIVQKIENYSETSNLGNRVNSVKDSMKDISSAGLTKEKKFPRIARPAEQESSGDKGEQETKGGGKIEPKRNNNGDNLSKLPSKAIDSASVKINNATLSKNQAEGRESNDDVFHPVADKYGRGNMTPTCRSKSQLSKGREFKNSKEMIYSSSSTKRKYRSRNHLLREKRNLMYKSILRKYYSSLKKYVKKFIDKTRVSTIHRSHQVAMLIRKDPQNKIIPPLKEGELIMRNVETRSASRRMRRKRNLQVDDDVFSDESSGLDKTTWRSYRTPKRRNHFTNCGKRRRQRMKRHIRPVRIDASSSDETPVAKTSSEEASVHAQAPAIVESVNDIGYIREHRSGAEVLPAPETIIKNLEEFVHGKKRKKISAPRVYLFGVPKKHRKVRNIEYYSDADSLLSLSDEDIFSKEVKGRKKYYMKHVKSHSRSVFKMPGTLIRKIKKMWKLEQNQHLYCEDEQECETSDVIIIRQPKYKIRDIPRHFVCKDCEMRSRGALLKDPFVYNVTNTAGVFSEEKIENKRNEVDDKEASGTSVIGTSCTNNRQSTLDENILHKLIGYNGFEYHCLSCKCDDCKVSKIPANFSSSRSKTGKDVIQPRNHWKSQADLENQTSRQCCRCAGRDLGEGRVGRKFIFYEKDFSQVPPSKEKSPLAAANRVDNCPSSSTPVETRDGSCPIKGGTDDVFFCEERKISNGCIAREKGPKNSEKVNRGFRAGIKRNNRVNSRKKGR
ncbi:uncharacterized protein LOC106668468 [Cimex lectularius]|uniref:Uncharacterized protein n=1 Tax=Cimex lectularius TaxID=79782 RepID=A0A8I6S3I9_CIMLE|nr:uncharacterized protein LOC106668468 [Cimex lectularius]